MVPYASEEDVEAVLARDDLYVSLPITNAVDLAEIFNRILDHQQGEQDD